MKRIWMRGVMVLAALCGLTPLAAWSHKPSDSYVNLVVQGDRVSMRWDIALRDLDLALDLNRNGDGQLTWGEVRARQPEIDAYTASRFALKRGDAACTLDRREPASIDRRSDGAYIVLGAAYRCPIAPTLEVNYRLFSDVDPTHRGIVRVVSGAITQTAVFDPNGPARSFRVDASFGWRDALRAFASFVREGVHHIGIGYDHLAFLIALLLPAALIRGRAAGERAWSPVSSLREAFVGALKIVTAFTVAHTLTLTLATLEILEPPSRGIEIAIAATVILAALNNIVPVATRRPWIVAFVFGLVHGFGLASGLREAGHSGAPLALTLFGFNVGVEIGQIAVVAIALPVVFALRHRPAYARGGMQVASLLLAGFGAIWLWERATGVIVLGV